MAQSPSFLVPLACPNAITALPFQRPIRRPSAHNAAHKPSHRPAPTCSQAPKTAQAQGRAPATALPEDARNTDAHKPKKKPATPTSARRPKQTAQNSPQVPTRKNSRIKTTTPRKMRPQRPARTPLTCEYLGSSVLDPLTG